MSEIDRKKEIERKRETDRQANRQTDKKTTKTDMQTDRQRCKRERYFKGEKVLKRKTLKREKK